MPEFDLIYYPFNIETQNEAKLNKISGGYQMNFDDSVFSKFVKSTFTCGIKNYIEIEIDSYDFHVALNDGAKEFYSECLEKIVEGDLKCLEEYSGQLSEYCSKYTLPEHPVPLTTTSMHFENAAFNSNKACERNSYYSVQIKIEDKVPGQIPKDIVENIKKDISGDRFKLQEAILSKFFAKRKMAKNKEIEEFYYKELKEEERKKISYTQLKKAVSLHAYFYVNGPWRHCWVGVGYDPTLHRENYKHQTLYYKDSHVPFQLKEYPKIIEKIEKKPDWFLLKKFDISDGFISKSLYDLIFYIIDKQKHLLKE